MSVQSRQAKVFAALLVSVTIGAIVLMALGNHPSSVGAFCLSSYNRLDPVEKAVFFQIPLSAERWNSIRVYCAGIVDTQGERVWSHTGNSTPLGNSHFVVCDGRFGGDGQIQPTDKWRRQMSITDNETGRSTRRTIYICVITDQKSPRPTDYQVKRTEALAEELLRVFHIRPESIIYPRDWQ